MKRKIMLTLIFAINFLVAFAHRDRFERPITYQFVFQNHKPITLDNPSDSVLKVYSDDIVSGERKLVSAELVFSTGEILTLKNDGVKWTEIKISYGKKVISVPNTTIEKIPKIHFMTIALLWDGRDKNAFGASYFYIQFDIGTEKSFKKYPYLELFFRNETFYETKIWRQISENSKQWTDF